MYPPIDFPTPINLANSMEQFSRLSKKQATGNFKWFLSHIPERLEILASDVTGTPGFDNWQADYSPDSLLSLGSWFQSRLEKRVLSESEIEEIRRNRAPAMRASWIKPWDLSHETYTRCFDLSIYWGTVLRQQHADVEWELVTRPPSNAHLYQFMLNPFSPPPCPAHLMQVFAHSLADGTQTGGRLRELYDVWTEHYRPATVDGN